MSRLWIFNLDAEEELAQMRAGASVTVASREVEAARERACASLARSIEEGGLLAKGDALVASLEGSKGALRSSLRGAAWCPTPSTVAVLDALGVPPEVRVDAHALAAANARETFAELDPLPGSRLVRTESELVEALGSRPPERAPHAGRAPAWRLRRSLCAAGRGRLLCEQIDERVESWAGRALPLGPIHVQPTVDVVLDVAVHGRVASSGAVRLGRVVGFRTDDARSPSPSPSPSPVPVPGPVPGPVPTPCERLREVAHGVARELVRLGYVGPFGVDGLLWLDGDGVQRFHAATDVNARFTMTFARVAPELVALQSVEQE